VGDKEGQKHHHLRCDAHGVWRGISLGLITLEHGTWSHLMFMETLFLEEEWEYHGSSFQM
jgi:hypothetical protein